MPDDEGIDLSIILEKAEATRGRISLSTTELRRLLSDSECAQRVRSDVAEIKAYLIKERNEARAALACCRKVIQEVLDARASYLPNADNRKDTVRDILNIDLRARAEAETTGKPKARP